MGEHLAQVLAGDGDFFSLAGGFSQLLMLGELRDLYQVRDRMDLEKLVGICFQKILQILPSMGQVLEEQQQECMESLRTLYQTTGRKEYREYRERLAEALLRLVDRRPVGPGIEGTALGLLYGYDDAFGERIARTAKGYIRGNQEMMAKGAAFLRGLFFSARDFVFVSRDFLELVDEMLERLPGPEFMKLLPELRMAFGYFTPLETDRIAAKAAAFHGKTRKELLSARGVSPKEYAYGEALDAFAQAEMKGGWM